MFYCIKPETGIPLGVTSFDGLSFDIGGKFACFATTSFFKLDFAGLFKGDDMVSSISLGLITHCNILICCDFYHSHRPLCVYNAGVRREKV